MLLYIQQIVKTLRRVKFYFLLLQSFCGTHIIYTIYFVKHKITNFFTEKLYLD